MYTGENKEEQVKITVINYDENVFDQKDTKSIEETLTAIDKSNMTWIKITGLHDVDIVEKIGSFFNLHPLLLEDVLDIDQRPREEEFGEYILIVLKRLFFDEKEAEVREVQISIIVGEIFVISFQEQADEIFDSVVERLSKGKGRIRKLGSDYLAYVLLDTVVDNYFVVLDQLARKIEIVEDDVIANPSQALTHTIHKLKRNVLQIHKSIWPLREIVNNLERAESSYIKETTSIYFRDVQNHIIQILDTMDSFREMLSGMFESYLSSVSNKLNEIMKVLTIISTIFIPLGFIAGWYGMNFKYMPELSNPFGYYITMIITAFLGVLMVLYFHRKHWI